MYEVRLSTMNHAHHAQLYLTNKMNYEMHYEMHKYKLWYILMQRFFTGHTSHNQSVMSPPHHRCSRVINFLP